MNSKKNLFYASLICGIIVTLFMLLAFGPSIIGLVKEEGIKFLLEVPKSYVDWYDDPTAFFFTYFIGYAIIWWRPLWGSVIIIFGCVLFFVFNIQNMGTLIFITPTLLVALLYILYWNEKRKMKINDA